MSEWQDKLIAELKRDWRRTSLLVVLTIVAIVLVIRQFVGGDPVTAQAGSEGLAPAGAPQGPAVPGATVTAPGKKNTWQDPGKLTEAPLPVFNRDPFVIEFNRFPPVPKPENASTKGVQAPDAAKVAEQKRMAELEILKSDAAKLQLQSILMGSEPRIIINGEIYHAKDLVRVSGDKAASRPFVLSRVTSTSAVLERDGFEVVLRLE